MKRAFSAALLVLTCGVAAAQQYKVLYRFTGGPDGRHPYAGLVRDVDGNLYGATTDGGDDGVGVVFALSRTGKEIVLQSFSGSNGAGPDGTLTRDQKGNLYGTTCCGGAYNNGTVFELDKATKQELFNSIPSGQGSVFAGVVRDNAGNLYGTSSAGGIFGQGMVFKLGIHGGSILHSFGGATDGSLPQSELLLDSFGNLYGTALYGGIFGCGTLFEIDASGKFILLHIFTGQPDGEGPDGPLLLDAEGNLYGTTGAGGDFNSGTVFKLDRAGKETVLYSFTGGADGNGPVGNLAMDAGGSFYGTTIGGGSGSPPAGTVFKLDATGKETVLQDFDEGGNGGTPEAGVIRDDNGNLYGTTFAGGNGNCNDGDTNGCGVVFEITP